MSEAVLCWMVNRRSLRRDGNLMVFADYRHAGMMSCAGRVDVLHLAIKVYVHASVCVSLYSCVYIVIRVCGCCL